MDCVFGPECELYGRSKGKGNHSVWRMGMGGFAPPTTHMKMSEYSRRVPHSLPDVKECAVGPSSSTITACQMSAGGRRMGKVTPLQYRQ